MAAIRDAGFEEIVLNEPTWAGYVQRDDDAVFSKHLEGAVWHHNFAGYMRQAGYEIEEFRFFPYRHPVSRRPDIFVLVIRARLKDR